MDINVEFKKAKKQDQLAIMNEDDDGLSVPNWLIDVLKWIARMEMANSSLSFSCKLFRQLCWPKLHGKEVKAHFVEWMWIDGDEDESGILQAKMWVDVDKLKFPLSNVPPPDYILGFKEIAIFYLDARVLEFLNCIAPKLDDIFLAGIGYIYEFGTKEEDKRTEMVDCLLNTLANKIGQFQFIRVTNFAKFNQFFSRFIDQFDSLSIFMSKGIDGDILYKWLTDRKKNEGNNQKVLELVHDEEFLRDFFVRVEQEFTNTNEPVNFLIKFTNDDAYPFILNVGEFTRKNDKTDEVLVAYNKQIGRGHVQLLLRCPNCEKERWKEEGEKKLKANRNKDATYLYVDIDEFGAFNDMA